jgi:hypothetical protein
MKVANGKIIIPVLVADMGPVKKTGIEIVQIIYTKLFCLI